MSVETGVAVDLSGKRILITHADWFTGSIERITAIYVGAECFLCLSYRTEKYRD